MEEKMTINEVSKKLNITQDTLRFYEKTGLIGPIRRDKRGYRNYQEDDLRRIEFVKCMRGAELSIDVLRTYLRLFDEGDETKEARKELLIKQKKILDEKISAMKEASERLEYKIALYNNGELDKYLEKDENKN